MFNKEGIQQQSYAAPRQILANVQLQASVGCRVPKTLGVTVGAKSIVPAGTPVNIDLLDLSTPVVAADATHVMNAVLLHDIDVTSVGVGGSANGTALYFGVVNLNRVDTDVATAIAAVAGAGSKNLIFIKA